MRYWIEIIVVIVLAMLTSAVFVSLFVMAVELLKGVL
jgi:hypothetical protein